MDKNYVIWYLEYFQEWRRGADIKQPEPQELGRVIDYALEYLKGNLK